MDNPNCYQSIINGLNTFLKVWDIWAWSYCSERYLHRFKAWDLEQLIQCNGLKIPSYSLSQPSGTTWLSQEVGYFCNSFFSFSLFFNLFLILFNVSVNIKLQPIPGNFAWLSFSEMFFVIRIITCGCSFFSSFLFLTI